MSDEIKNDKNNKKIIELWEGYEVELDEGLIDDFDYITELNEAVKAQDFATITSMYFALVGGDKTYQDARKYLIDKYGRPSIQGLGEITQRIADQFPKVGNRAQRRSWQTSK